MLRRQRLKQPALQLVAQTRCRSVGRRRSCLALVTRWVVLLKAQVRLPSKHRAVAAQGLKTNPIDYFTDTMLRTDTPAPGTDPNAADFQRQAGGILSNLLSTGEISEGDKAWLANQIVARTGIPQADAQTRVNQTVERVQAVRTAAQQKLMRRRRSSKNLERRLRRRSRTLRQQRRRRRKGAHHRHSHRSFLLAASSLAGRSCSLYWRRARRTSSRRRSRVGWPCVS